MRFVVQVRIVGSYHGHGKTKENSLILFSLVKHGVQSPGHMAECGEAAYL